MEIELSELIDEQLEDEPVEEEAPKPKRRSKPSVIQYLGGGFIQGIPARDLTPDEWEALGETRQQIAIDSGCYKE